MTKALRLASKHESAGQLDAADELDALFKRHHRRLNRLCARWTRGHLPDAQDLLAETYLRAVRAAVSGGLPPDNPLAWLSAVIANLARDRLRARARASASADDGSALEALRDPNDTSDGLLASRELLARTLGHVRGLPPALRRALLARSAGENYEVIATALDTSPTNARKLVQAARKQLRARLRLSEAGPSSTRR